MKKLLKILLVVPLLLMSTGCPLSLSEPIDQPNVPVDNSWFGTYTGTLPSDYPLTATVNRWIVGKQSDYEYKIVGKEDVKPEEQERKKRTGTYLPTDVSYTAHISLIKDQAFLNIYDGNGTYSFFRIEPASKGFLIKEISPSLFGVVETADQLKTTIINDMDKDELYGTSFTMEKK